MKRLYLTPEEKEHFETLHASNSNKKESDRIKAILLRSEGWTIPQISQALRLHQTTINRHILDYKNDKIKAESGGSESFLTEEMSIKLIEHLEQNTYAHVHEIIIYVKETFNIEYSVPGMNKWLHRNDFSYKKPKGIPHKADPVLQREFIEKYEELKKTVDSDEPILFMDSVHPTQATKITHGWIKKGKNKLIETTAGRTRVNIIGAIQLEALSEAITSEYETINGESIVDFMKKIREKHSEKKTIHLILDQAGYHRSDVVIEASKKMNIQLNFLPPYSPNLNPIERLWKVMNEETRNNKFFKSGKDFKEAIKKFFEVILPNIADSLNGRINDNFQLLKT